MNQPNDMFGNKIIPGDCIVYPVRKGANTSMHVAKVVNIGTRKNYLSEEETILFIRTEVNNKLRRSIINKINRVVIVPRSYLEKSSFQEIL
jgi:hypothetical protein